MPNPISERTLFFVDIFKNAIKPNPNDVGKTTARLLELCIDRETFDELLLGMSDPNSELARVLTQVGKAFHSTSESDAAPDDIEPKDLKQMAEQIRSRSGLR